MMNDNFKSGKNYWRSLDQIKDTPEFRDFLQREFPQGASEMDNSWSRRHFIQLMGASLALAGLASCRRPVEKVVPYVIQPEEITPGVPAYYATTMPLGLSAHGLLVKSNEGRPTKIEGNKEHPSSRGGTNIWHQAAILGLYDPDRSKSVMHKGAEASWDDFVSFWRERTSQFQTNGGTGLAVISESFNSPTLMRLKAEMQKRFPLMTWATYEPISDENVYTGVHTATGRVLQPVCHIDRAKVILSLDSDFLQTESENAAAMLGFAEGRRVMSTKDDMNRLYVVESAYTVTGGMADHRLRFRSCEIPIFALALARELASQGLRLDFLKGISGSIPPSVDSKWLSAVARDLIRAKGNSLILAGRRQPEAVHALVLALNVALGNVGSTVTYHELPDASYPDRQELAKVSQAIQSGSVDTLVMIGGNPAYNVPVDLQLASLIGRISHSVHLSPYMDETSSLSEWHIPEAHFLECWGDARAVDGTAGVIQPLIAPLFGGKSKSEMLTLLATGRSDHGYDIVRDTWRNLLPALSFEPGWRKTLHDGYFEKSAIPATAISIDDKAVAAALTERQLSPGAALGNSPEIVFTVSHLYDGRFANNGWLQELPDSVTKLTWDNVASVSQAFAARLGVANGDMVKLEIEGYSLEMPVWVTPGQVDNSIAVPLGYGRTGVGNVANGVGFDTYKLRRTEPFGYDVGASVSKLGRRYDLSTTQNQGSMEGRPIVREATLEEFRRGEEFKPKQFEHPPLVPLWTEEHQYTTGYQWGMAIDLNACTGCNACTIACQSENNIPIVGKEQVNNGRVMHWIRVDRYFAGPVDNPEMVHQPVPCQQCENAPCENVCPVGATMHDSEGLNVQVYNRCIGTRYCSNNCPYKVRRFNFFNYTKDLPETMRMQQNPDVTVRSRGVMEKCTYCVQRISQAKIKAKEEGRTVADGEFMTACQQACPARAIEFGNINDPNSKVAKLKKLNRNYAMLQELNVRPRTSYLAKLRNPNPELG